MKSIRDISLLIFLLSTSGINTVLAEAAGKAESYSFAVFPYLSATRLEAIYAPVSAELARVLGKNVHFRTSSSFKKFFTKLKQQDYDIALIQPFWYPPAVDQFGYQSLVRMEEPFTSLIMVLDDSPLKTVEDLKGKVIATPPAFVPVVHMANRALQESGLQPGVDVQLKAFKSVDSCFQQLLIQSASACVAPPFAPAVIEEQLNVRLRVILETPSIPNLSVVVGPRVTVQDREIIRQTLLSWTQTENGRQLLKAIKTRRFVPAVDGEYDVVRRFIKDINNDK